MKTKLSAVGFLVLSAGMCAACSASSSGTSAGSGGCNQIPNAGSVVTKTANTASVPAWTGGTIADGTYIATSIIDYGHSSPGPTKHQTTLMISGSTLQAIDDQSGSGSQGEQRYTATLSESGSDLTLDVTCPSGAGTLHGKFTATSTQLVWSTDDPQEVTSYVKQ